MPQAAQLNVDGAVERHGGAPTRPVQQLVAVQHPLRMRQEHHQQVELGTGQLHRLALGIGQVARTGVQRPAGKGVEPGGDLPRQVSVVRAAQYRARPGDQFARVKRLGQVVVGAQLDADDSVHCVALRGDHDDRHRQRAAAEAAANRQSVLAWHHQVKYSQTGYAKREVEAWRRTVSDRAYLRSETTRPSYALLEYYVNSRLINKLTTVTIGEFISTNFHAQSH